jgi:hypothetical protein
MFRGPHRKSEFEGYIYTENSEGDSVNTEKKKTPHSIPEY